MNDLFGIQTSWGELGIAFIVGILTLVAIGKFSKYFDKR